MRLFAAAFMLFACWDGPALAQETHDKSFQGPSVTAIGGVDIGQWYDGAQAGALYGGQLGYDWQSNGLLLGVEGEAAAGPTPRHCITIYQVNGADDRACVKPKHDLYVGGRIGAVLGESTLFYAKAGYTNARQIFDYRAGGSGSPSYVGSGTTNGFRLGAGVEKHLGEKMSLKTEYRYSNYEGSYSRHQAVIGLGFRF